MTARTVYPNNKEIVTPGDILYSSKGWSTFLVGHVGIVGPDLRIYHSHPRGGFADSLPGYLSRHKFGGEMTVFHPNQGALEAATWASEHIHQIQKYIFHPFLWDIKYNYCSKFLWQAFWYTGENDVTGRNLTGKSKNWVYPYNIKYSPFLEMKTTFRLQK